jgi:uncharacterized protein DUF1501
VLRGGLAALCSTLVRPAVARAPRPQAAAIGKPRAKNVIVLWMTGGPSHLDTFDMKPGTKGGGTFRPMRTEVDGIEICEHLPQLAKRARHLAIVRSLHSTIADHDRARLNALTGHVPNESLRHPSFLVSAATELGPARPVLPSVVVVGQPFAAEGYLGESAAPLVIGSAAVKPQSLLPPAAVSAARQAARRELLDRFDRDFAARTASDAVERSRQIAARAAELTSDGTIAHAFDLAGEPDALRDAYGRNEFGTACLLARRLLQHGVRFLQLELPGWDTHVDNFDTLQLLMGSLDPAFATLLDDLEQHELLRDTLILWMGEFGRTPEVNVAFGRDHHWRCFSAVLAGGGVRGGRVIGATDATGSELRDRPVAIPDLLATIYAALGLDPGREFTTPDGRPVRRLDGGTPLPELFA